MPKESFLYPETQLVFDLIEETSRRSGVSRGQAFEDFLHMSLCALSGGLMEEQYLVTVKKHSDGTKGKRGCDSIAHAFGALVDAMENTRKDILGDIFQGAITYGEAGQFMTPEPVCQMMARMTIEGADEKSTGRRTVSDPCCGSGRMLLAVAELQPHWEFVGQDVDLRCVRMTAINFALRNLYGHVIWGNSLKNEKPRLV
ncbi:MAG TPA: N-6 DNA methylase [Planctomycetaceae bacterium]|nr:N-6 DNA methylase [Planctomycetaceae bacterium]